MTTPFEQLQLITDAEGVDSGLDFLEQHVRREQEYAQLFEVLKMRVRHRMGLPILYSRRRDDLDVNSQRKLENGLLEACREVGTLFFEQGDFVRGWSYLQPVGDRVLNERLVRGVKVDDQSADDLIDVAVMQGAAPAYGFQMLLQRYGTCDAITTFDRTAANYDLECQQAMARALLNHLCDELVENLISSLPQLKSSSGRLTLKAILDSDELNQEPSCVIDATHLASVVRIAKILQDSTSIQKAYELARYGDLLSDDLKYPGQPPFEDVFPDHLHYYGASLGQNVEAAIEHFGRKIQQHDARQYGGIVIETFVDLLAKVGKHDQAIKVLLSQLLGKYSLTGIAPELQELAKTAEQKRALMKHYRGESDILGFSQTLFSSKTDLSVADDAKKH